ncbi:hypothetical protein FHX49_000011 [Microbacterium endophyticum]|uniref:Helix-turn-helix domain-containing protein n=1 Tax=Microbacterium endophyticum TaxID=1526412 RepID=A0A7W4YKK8_9MICO|nr:hypothetical protein [Microbacterium endophyticum]MBB2974470.1 hypothetical protein [Microbacterium endophyticum]NIK36767.1 hypothetical protein [Microbacterium endophyticum]
MNNATTTIQRAPSGQPVCRVCAHVDVDEIVRSLAVERLSVAEVAGRYGVGRDSIYRHLKNHESLRLVGGGDAAADEENLSLVESVAAIADRARNASKLAYQRGDLRLGGVLGDSAVRATNSLAALGVTSEAIAASFASASERSHLAQGLALAVENAALKSPEIAEPLARELEALGLHEWAEFLREEKEDSETGEHNEQ